MKWLLWSLALGLAFLWVTRALRSARGRGRPAAKSAPSASASSSAPPPLGMPATMVACAHCGVHLPEREVIRDAAGRPFCGDAHRQAGVGVVNRVG